MRRPEPAPPAIPPRTARQRQRAWRRGRRRARRPAPLEVPAFYFSRCFFFSVSIVFWQLLFSLLPENIPPPFKVTMYFSKNFTRFGTCEHQHTRQHRDSTRCCRAHSSHLHGAVCSVAEVVVCGLIDFLQHMGWDSHLRHSASPLQ